MIAITGASGQLGHLVIESLLSKTQPSNIVALVRNPEAASDLTAKGIEVRYADYDKPETVQAALQGVDKLLLISSNAVGQRMPQHQAVIDAAKTAGVSLLAYTSILKADTNPMMLAHEHKQTEAAIRASGVPAVILRNGWYTENYTQGLGTTLAINMVAGTAGEGKLHTAARRDYAEAAATVLTSEQEQAGKVYELAGDTGFSLAQYAQAVAELSQQPVQYNNVPEKVFSDLLEQVGLPERFAAALADAEVQAEKGWLAHDETVLSQLIGRATTPFTETIKAELAALA